MTLMLEIEYLNGMSYSAVGPESSVSEWPPQPDRVFSALVATWAYRGKNSAEVQALEWLEQLPPPMIQASPAQPRTSVISYVPPNDPSSFTSRRSKGKLKTVSPMLRWRQPRRFPAVRPESSIVRLIWPGVLCNQAVYSALMSLGADTSYIGHSASLTRCRFMLADNLVELDGLDMPKRRIYPGRFAQLRDAFDSGRRPSRGDIVKVEAAFAGPIKPRPSFGSDWLLLESAGEGIFDLRAHALVAQELRSLIMSAYRDVGFGNRIPEEISGHGEGGLPGRGSHMAIVPLAFVGFPHADGHLLGLGLVPSQGSAILKDPVFLKVMRALSHRQADGRRIITMRFPLHGNVKEFKLVLTSYPGRASVDPSRYTVGGTTFGTVTPIVLDRFPKKQGEARHQEIVGQIVEACRYIGLPDPDSVVAGASRPSVIPSVYSAIEGAPPARAGRKEPEWTRWQLPPHLARRPLTHIVVRFSQPVEGPVILGAGRFMGMGLCLPIDDIPRRAVQ